MFNPSKLFFFRKTAPAPQAAPVAAPVEIREDFFIENVDNMTLREVLNALRERTVRFTTTNDLLWGVTDFNLREVQVRVKLTEAQDVAYVINGINTFDLQEAIRMIKNQQVF